MVRDWGAKHAIVITYYHRIGEIFYQSNLLMVNFTEINTAMVVYYKGVQEQNVKSWKTKGGQRWGLLDPSETCPYLDTARLPAHLRTPYNWPLGSRGNNSSRNYLYFLFKTSKIIRKNNYVEKTASGYLMSYESKTWKIKKP